MDDLFCHCFFDFTGGQLIVPLFKKSKRICFVIAFWFQWWSDVNWLFPFSHGTRWMICFVIVFSVDFNGDKLGPFLSRDQVDDLFCHVCFTSMVVNWLFPLLSRDQMDDLFCHCFIFSMVNGCHLAPLLSRDQMDDLFCHCF